MHIVTGRWKLGLALALTTAIFWGMLPIALKIALRGMDAYTITWYRFTVSAVVLGGVLALLGRLPSLRGLKRRVWWVLAIGLGGLAGNYVFYLLGLKHATPTVTQTVIQLAPMFLLLGGMILFKERFSPLQWLGFGTLLVGLLLFFNKRLPELFDLNSGIGLGVVLIVISAVVWAAYGLAQKALLKEFDSQQILLLIYIGAVILLLPTAAPATVQHMNGLQLGMLVFSCINTLVAYGAFAEALEHWEISRVSAVLATAPLFTILTSWLLQQVAPDLLTPEGLNALSICGALLVVSGSAICALAASGARRARKNPDDAVAQAGAQ